MSLKYCPLNLWYFISQEKFTDELKLNHLLESSCCIACEFKQYHARGTAVILNNIIEGVMRSEAQVTKIITEIIVSVTARARMWHCLYATVRNSNKDWHSDLFLYVIIYLSSPNGPNWPKTHRWVRHCGENPAFPTQFQHDPLRSSCSCGRWRQSSQTSSSHSTLETPI